MKRTASSALLTIATVIALTACTVPASDDGETAADRADTSGAANKKAKTKAGSDKKKKDAPKETAGQANARESAANYLDLTGFSRLGLINQLINGDGFSKADATYGVDAQKADYKKQAALSAQNYLDISSFSHQGLVDQLVNGDMYTKEQAEAGVKAVGL